ncbi:GNAT family N-acetyltransferase [Patescibacteria group bacterium]|nr:GNAT family N-acetyltransferase [Patescibacteria group bacterium]
MIRIRKTVASDINTIQSIKSFLSPEIIEERLARQKKDEAEFLLLEKDGEIVSFVLLKWGGKPTHPEYPDMEDLYTKETERRKGYGRILVSECEKKAAQRGFNKIGLSVNPNLNPKAKKFYEKLGYKHDKGKEYLDGIYNGIEDWVIDLEKSLN